MQWSWVSTAVSGATENQMKITASLYSFIAFDMVDYLKLNLFFGRELRKHMLMFIFTAYHLSSQIFFMILLLLGARVRLWFFSTVCLPHFSAHKHVSSIFFLLYCIFLAKNIEICVISKKRWKLVGHSHKQIRSDGRWCNTDKIILSTNWFGWLI